MFSAIILAAASLSLNASMDQLVEVQMKVGMCERHMTLDQIMRFDPSHPSLPRPVQAELFKARTYGRELAKEAPLSASGCNKLFAQGR